MGFDLVYAKDGYKAYINCNGEGNYRIEFGEGPDVPDRCPSPKSAAKSGAVEKGEQVVLDREAGFVDLPKQDSRAPTGPGYP